jgi:dipeptidyl-peptidase 4
MRKFIFLFMLLCSAMLNAQTRQMTIEDAAYGYYTLAPETYGQLHWASDNQHFFYILNDNVRKGKLGDGYSQLIVSKQELNKLLEAKEINEAWYSQTLSWMGDTAFCFEIGNGKVCYSIANKQVRIVSQVGPEASNVDYSASLGVAAYTVYNNLYVSENGRKKAVTSDVDINQVSGQFVSRNEFGIEKGTFWSPRGDFLAFYRKDESRVSNYTFIDITTRVATPHTFKYPMAGMPGERVSVGVYNVKTGARVYIEADTASGKYLTNLTWDPTGKYIYLAVLNREQDHLWLNQYDAMNGAFVKTLREETNEHYVEPLNPLFFLNLDATQFIYQSRNNGYNHLYIGNTASGVFKQITTGEWEVTKFYGISPDDKFAFFQATAESPLCRDVYSINLKNGQLKKLTSGKGTHNATFSADYSVMFDEYNAATVPYELHVVKTADATSSLQYAASNPLAEYKLGRKKFGTIKAADNKTDLYYKLILPASFNASEKYPVFVYVYGGPHDQEVTDSWSDFTEYLQLYMAQKGYVVFVLDNRGSSNRGLVFENVNHRNLGSNEIEDQMRGVEFLKSLPYVDSTRLSIHGWSYGGFMTVSMMLRKPGVFKAAVAGAPVIDWKYYEVMYGERYMDTPDENPDGYAKASCLSYAANLQGKLLVIHGDQDSTVVWQNTLSFMSECIKKGTQPDYFIYPGQDHGISWAYRVHLLQKIVSYIDENLK